MPIFCLTKASTRITNFKNTYLFRMSLDVIISKLALRGMYGIERNVFLLAIGSFYAGKILFIWLTAFLVSFLCFFLFQFFCLMFLSGAVTMPLSTIFLM